MVAISCTTWDVRKLINNGMFTTYELVQDLATIHGKEIDSSLRPWSPGLSQSWNGEEEDVARLSKFESGIAHDSTIATLWLFNIAMENGPFIDGLTIKNGDFIFHGYVK